VLRQWPRLCAVNVETMGGQALPVNAASVPAETPNRR
jgi:hypothetical protein